LDGREEKERNLSIPLKKKKKLLKKKRNKYTGVPATEFAAEGIHSSGGPKFYKKEGKSRGGGGGVAKKKRKKKRALNQLKKLTAPRLGPRGKRMGRGRKGGGTPGA